MDNTKNDIYYLEKIRKDLTFIVEQMKGVELEDLANHEILQDSMLFRLIQISENAKRLSNELREEHVAIPWMAIYGLRNRIVHDYGSVDLGIVYDTLKNDIPGLLSLIEKEF